MKRKLLWIFAIAWTIMTVGLLGFANHIKAADMNKEQFANMLKQVLKEDPSIFLNILSEHSEIILDIAQQGSNQRRLKALTAQWKRDMEQPKPVALNNRPIRGSVNAPVTIVVFSDFSCPYCMQAAKTLEGVMAERTGKARMVFKHFPLEGHKFSRLASDYHVAATFQSPEKAWIFHDLLFNYGNRLNDEGEALIRKAAEEAGLDMKQLSADLRNSSAKIKAIIEEDIADAKRLGISGTPNFLINDLVVKGAVPKDVFVKAVDLAHENIAK